jgi:hypothetical protein
VEDERIVRYYFMTSKRDFHVRSEMRKESSNEGIRLFLLSGRNRQNPQRRRMTTVTAGYDMCPDWAPAL